MAETVIRGRTAPIVADQAAIGDRMPDLKSEPTDGISL